MASPPTQCDTSTELRRELVRGKGGWASVAGGRRGARGGDQVAEEEAPPRAPLSSLRSSVCDRHVRPRLPGWGEPESLGLQLESSLTAATRSQNSAGTHGRSHHQGLSFHCDGSTPSAAASAKDLGQGAPCVVGWET